MALPLSRERTYSPASPVASNDLNVIQDMIIGGKHGPKVLNISPFSGSTDPSQVAINSCAWGHSTGGYVASSAVATGVDRWIVPLPLHEGDRLSSITFARFGDGTVDMDVTLEKMTSGGTQSVITTLNLTNLAGAWTDSTLDPADFTVAAGETFYIAFAPNAANARIGSIRMTYHRP